VLFKDRDLEEMLDYVKASGCEAIEVGTGGYVGAPHITPAELLGDEGRMRDFERAVSSRGLEISALSCHGNPLHPNARTAEEADTALRDSIRLATKLGVRNVVTFSGCPGDSASSERPNWVTCPWPPDFLETLEWQWTECAQPYWSEMAAFANDHGVHIAVELHPGFLVYNTASFLRLRDIGGEAIGANFDPSHLFWQGMDPLVCIRELGDAIYHVHLKDTWLDEQNISRNGVLDTTPYRQVQKRSSQFRTIGYGHGEEFWRSMISELRMAGYDGVLSIEHEDALMSVNEGFSRAVDLLRDCLITEPPATAWWS
ncbi:MAG: sugar phosphate isomerase/epimerase, partial [Chloroflexota bacterium]|nr:sugar phosphate isomerase/epimerase [Chloroflexota bacterium]